MSEHVVLRKDGEIAWLVLNRPEKRNAMNLAMLQRLPDLLAEVERDPDVKVLVLRGADARAFSAGADISEFEEQLLRARSGGTAQPAEPESQPLESPSR